jgi:PAS domain S-box-containing protein
MDADPKRPVPTLFEQASGPLIRALPLAVYALDGQEFVRGWNPAAERLFGWAEAEVLGRAAPHALLGLRPFHAEVLQGTPSAGMEVRCGTKAGGCVDLHLAAAPLHNGQGEVCGLVAVACDISARKRGEEERAHEHAVLRGILNAIPDLIYHKDGAGVYRACNTAFEKYLGRGAADVLGRSDADLLPPERAERARARDRQALEGSDPRRSEEVIEYPDGRRVLLEELRTPFFGPDHTPLGLIGIGRDITERRQLEAQLLQAQKMEAVGQLAGGIAHDFNNLLTVILGNLSLLLNGEPDAPQGRQLLLATEKAGWRAAELVRQLLSFSRQTVLSTQPTRLPSLMEEIAGILRRTIDPRIRIDVRYPNDLWTAAADPGQIGQVLMNLCLNSRDAMPEGGQLLIEADNVLLDEEFVRQHPVGRAGDYVRLRVSDTGHGIPPDVQPRIFEPFFTTKAQGKGTGLGLAMVFGILKQHGGWVECHSEVNRGTRFDLYLPRQRPSAAAGPEQGPETARPDTGTETVLLVDDEALVREVAATYLQRYGYQVLTAADGAQAADVYQRERGQVALVLLDLVMPGLSGRETLHRLRAINPNVRVLYSSGYPEAIDEASVHDNVVGFLAKPYQPQELAHAVRAALDAGRK